MERSGILPQDGILKSLLYSSSLPPDFKIGGNQQEFIISQLEKSLEDEFAKIDKKIKVMNTLFILNLVLTFLILFIVISLLFLSRSKTA